MKSRIHGNWKSCAINVSLHSLKSQLLSSFFFSNSSALVIESSRLGRSPVRSLLPFPLPIAAMAEQFLEDLIAKTKRHIQNRKPNAAIIAQLTSGKERQQPAHLYPSKEEIPQPIVPLDSGVDRRLLLLDSGIDLKVHVSVDFIRGASLAIGIFQQTKCATTGLPIHCGLEAKALKFGHHSGELEQAHIEAPKDAQMYALVQAMSLTRETIRNHWPGDSILRAVIFRIGLANPYPSHCIATVLEQSVQRLEKNSHAINQGPPKMHKVMKQISRLRAEMADRFEGSVRPIWFEDEEERTEAYDAAKQKQKALQSSPRWKRRWERKPIVTEGQKRVGKIVREYRARAGC